MMKKMLFTNWHLMRWIRLFAAFGITYHAFATEQYFFLFFAAFFLFQAVFNTCSSGSCQIPKSKTE
jgi:uncharacterized membrane protein HdeD (DUF308 family)